MKTKIKAAALGLGIFIAVTVLCATIEYVGHLFYGWDLTGDGYTVGLIFGFILGLTAAISICLEDAW